MSMVLTPSTKSGGIAGFTFWGMVWLAMAKLDAFAELFHLPKKWFNTKHVFGWTLRHKGIALVFTELVNYTIHGIKSTTGVVFAIGGTIFNTLAIFLFLPVINIIKGESWVGHKGY